jgi:hypothetical protein
LAGQKEGVLLGFYFILKGDVIVYYCKSEKIREYEGSGGRGAVGMYTNFSQRI